ncbi:TRAP transporter small permease subunit [Chloroflexota bacterium]
MLQRLISGIDRITGILSVSAGVVAGVATVLMALMITVDIIVRELLVAGYIGFKWPFVVDEWTGYLVVLIGFFALAYTFRAEGHINVDLVVRRLSARARCELAALTSFLSLIVAGYLTYLGVLWVKRAVEQNIGSNYISHTPMWIPSLFVPIGLAIFCLAILLYTVRKVLEAIRSME